MLPWQKRRGARPGAGAAARARGSDAPPRPSGRVMRTPRRCGRRRSPCSPATAGAADQPVLGFSITSGPAHGSRASRLPSAGRSERPGPISVPVSFTSPPALTQQLDLGALHQLWQRAGAAPTGFRGRCSRRSTRSSRTSARTWARAPPAPSAGCSSCRRPGCAGASTRTATASPIRGTPADAVYSAARYLAAAGGQTDISRAIFAYNHADWYVREVLDLAQRVRQRADRRRPPTCRSCRPPSTRRARRVVSGERRRWSQREEQQRSRASHVERGCMRQVGRRGAPLRPARGGAASGASRRQLDGAHEAIAARTRARRRRRRQASRAHSSAPRRRRFTQARRDADGGTLVPRPTTSSLSAAAREIVSVGAHAPRLSRSRHRRARRLACLRALERGRGERLARGRSALRNRADDPRPSTARSGRTATSPSSIRP